MLIKNTTDFNQANAKLKSLCKKLAIQYLAITLTLSS